MRRLALGMLCALSLAAPAMAQERILHVGLRQDPDLLDPTLGSSYVGRIVFSGLCDKLFDIDAKLNIVPVLATGYEWKDPTHLIIHVRDGVQFQDGEKLDADAVKYKLTRDLTIKGSMRRGEVNSIDSDRRDRSADRAAQPEGACRAVAGAVDRSRRHHDLAEGSARRRATSSACIRYVPGRSVSIAAWRRIASC